MRYLLPCLLMFTFFSCSTVSSPPDRDVPKTFDENKGSLSEIRSNGGGGDVVNSMYDEVVDNDANLKALEKDIRNNTNAISDAKNAYNNFAYNNSNYYNSAMNHANSIGDSALKAKAKALIEASSSQYQRLVAKHNSLLNETSWKQASLNDVHTFLKLMKTIPGIENYQKKNLPDTKPMENASSDLDKIIQRTKEAAKQ